MMWRLPRKRFATLPCIDAEGRFAGRVGERTVEDDVGGIVTAMVVCPVAVTRRTLHG